MESRSVRSLVRKQRYANPAAAVFTFPRAKQSANAREASRVQDGGAACQNIVSLLARWENRSGRLFGARVPPRKPSVELSKHPGESQIFGSENRVNPNLFYARSTRVSDNFVYTILPPSCTVFVVLFSAAAFDRGDAQMPPCLFDPELSFPGNW